MDSTSTRGTDGDLCRAVRLPARPLPALRASVGIPESFASAMCSPHVMGSMHLWGQKCSVTKNGKDDLGGMDGLVGFGSIGYAGLLSQVLW